MKIKLALTVAVLVFVLLFGIAFWADPSKAGDTAALITALSNPEYLRSLAVLCFGAFVIYVEYQLLVRNGAPSEDILRIFSVTLIILVSLELVLGGFSKDQIAAPLGLFGTIMGYILGSANRPK
jgi:hypothetical protein